MRGSDEIHATRHGHLRERLSRLHVSRDGDAIRRRRFLRRVRLSDDEGGRLEVRERKIAISGGGHGRRGVEMIWTLSDRADPEVRPMADRHYNRQSPGSTHFVPPGRCLVLKRPDAFWVTSW